MLSLTTGAVWSAHFGEAFGVSDINVYAWDLRWSPDGRWLGASVANREVAGLEHWYALLEPSVGRVESEMWHAKQWPDPPLPIMVSLEAAGWPPWRPTRRVRPGRRGPGRRGAR